MDSILTSIKKLLGLEENYTHFDDEIIVHINSVFPTLAQLGVGPSTGFVIYNNMTVWDDFIPDRKDLESVKTYIYLKVKLVFDPPSSSAVMEAIKNTINELEWRLNIAVDSDESEV